MSARLPRSLRFAVPAVFGLLALAFPAAGMAQLDGSLDLAFDGPGGSGNGKFLHPSGTQSEELTDVAIQSDGKIVVVGEVDVDPTAGQDFDLVVSRFNASNGSLDVTFDGPAGTGNGSFTLHPSAGDTFGAAVDIDSAGRIVIAGSTDQPGALLEPFAIRLDSADGALDSTFGNAGLAVASFNATDDFATGLALDKFDRPIVLAHSTDLEVARFEVDGDQDPTFDTDGEETIDVGTSDISEAVGVQPSGGKIVILGRTTTAGGGADLALVRLDPTDGSLDASFDGPATATTAFPGNGKFAVPLSPGAVNDLPGGLAFSGTKILAGGQAGTGTAMAIARLNVADGSLDSTFDGDGIATTTFGGGSGIAEDLTVDSRNRIVAVGSGTGSNLDMAAARFDATGALDSFFDGDSGTGDGKVVVSFGATNETANAVALEADGDIVLAGEIGTNADGAMARLKVDLIEPNTFTSGPSGVTSDPNPVFSITSTETASSVQCTIDAAPVACTTGGGQQFGPFADGSHTLTAAAVDQSGNVDSVPATRTFTVDTTAPDATIDSGLGLTNDPTPTIAFSASEASVSFQCRIDPDGGPIGSFAACLTPFTPASPLPDGDYTLNVRTTDQVGNVDPSDATGTFTIDATAPETTIGGSPSSVTFGSSEDPATFECSLDGAPFTSCTSPQSIPPQAPGAHSFAVRATDLAGNTDQTPAALPFTVQPPPTAQPPTVTPPKRCKKGQKLKKGKCVKKKRRK